MLCVSAKDCELCKVMQESFNLDHVLAGILKTFGGSPDDQLTLLVSWRHFICSSYSDSVASSGQVITKRHKYLSIMVYTTCQVNV